MDDIESPDVPDAGSDFFSDDQKDDSPSLSDDQVYMKLLSLSASSADWQNLVDDLDVSMMRRLIEAYGSQNGRKGAIRILERRISKRDDRRLDGETVRSEPATQPMMEQRVAVQTEKEEENPWFPERWKEVREAVKDVARPICFMCSPVYDALVENKGIFDDKFGPDEKDVCKKANVVWHWNVCFAARNPNLNLKLGG